MHLVACLLHTMIFEPWPNTTAHAMVVHMFVNHPTDTNGDYEKI